ncbi:hypothetical protein G3545_02290 [Starkeya sp. ORNL1]|uniref:DUF6894 family protein n=1 Tax=Starkeya sp. ORNL1 TaxID=2709380 RepID=UPI0014634C31|nr:hypothetical protein [Starkeya sp. ORNL1]QJP12595.1 hypothetical protein G3545_02290 [Starkeya sp. ORNL1]
MPHYTFTISGELHGHNVVLKDDDAAWSELVTWTGEVLRDESGKLPPNSSVVIEVEDDKGARIASVEVRTTRLR